jgi:hypothetical protein
MRLRATFLLLFLLGVTCAAQLAAQALFKAQIAEALIEGRSLPVQVGLANATDHDGKTSVGDAGRDCASFTACSQFCSGQSTQKPQGSTRIGRYTVCHSIKITYCL